MPPQPDPKVVARDTHDTARQALDRYEQALTSLEQAVGNLTDPEAIAGVGNLASFAFQARAELAAARRALSTLVGQHDQLRGFLDQAGVPWRQQP